MKLSEEEFETDIIMSVHVKVRFCNETKKWLPCSVTMPLHSEIEKVINSDEFGNRGKLNYLLTT